ncbi:MAG: hypothetical protein JWM44_4200 [Bacilli bacterium]|nr:hypothetical protein [Bacilli bacterium]
MRRTKNRLRKKFINKVTIAQKLGNMQKFYARQAAILIGDMFDYQYITVFRPSWYDQIDKWSEMSLSDAIKIFIDKFEKQIQKDTGINIKALDEYLKQFPKRQYRERELREPKEQPIRKLKNPETFQITAYKNKEIVKQEVSGEVVFTIQGYAFFIRHDQIYGWVVSDVAEGKRIANSSRYAVAVKNGKEIMEKHIDEYVKRITALK